MFEKINKKSLVAVVLIGTITVTGATTAFAADRGSGNRNFARKGTVARTSIADMSTAIKGALDKLVSAGTITQAQEDAVLKVFTANKGKVKPQGAPTGEHKNPIDALVTAGTITQAQADAIGNAIKDGRSSQKTLEDVLNSLVTAGTITQAQADAILKAMPSNMRPMDGRRGPGGEHKNPMDALVTAGTITQAQADAIRDAMKSGMEARKSMEDVLGGLVSAGTITQAQADAVIKTMPERKGPMDVLVTAGTITQAQADAIHDALKSGLEAKKSVEEVLGGLVTAGTITQAQSDAVLKAMPAKGGRLGSQVERKSPIDELVTAGTITQAQADAINSTLKTVFDSFHKSK